MSARQGEWTIKRRPQMTAVCTHGFWMGSLQVGADGQPQACETGSLLAGGGTFAILDTFYQYLDTMAGLA